MFLGCSTNNQLTGRKVWGCQQADTSGCSHGSGPGARSAGRSRHGAPCLRPLHRTAPAVAGPPAAAPRSPMTATDTGPDFWEAMMPVATFSGAGMRRARLQGDGVGRC